MRGYFLMAKEYAWLLRSAGMIAPEDEWARRDTVADELLWENRFTTVVDERAAARRVAYLTSGWPFKAGETGVPSIPASDTLGRLAEEMITKVKTWEEAHIAAAEYYEKRGEFTLAAGEYRMLMKQEPYNSSAYLLLARTYVRLNRLPEARETLERSITVEPTVYACRTLGVVVMNESRFGDAAGYFEKGVTASGSDRERSDLGFLLGLALYRNNETDRARVALENALKANQYNQQAISLLERINAGGK
jgi:tetratricopeptide (TPR) repeat protein